MTTCSHTECSALRSQPATFHMNFRGPFRKFLRERDLRHAIEGDLALFSAWWPCRGLRSDPAPTELMEQRRGIIEFIRPGACNVLSDKRRLAAYLQEFCLTHWAPLTLTHPLEPFPGTSATSADESLWFLKHVREDGGRGVSVHLGLQACRDAWLAMPQPEHDSYVAQHGVRGLFVDEENRKMTVRVFVLAGLVRSTDDGRARAWSFLHHNCVSRAHPLPYDPSDPHIDRHVTSVSARLGKVRSRVGHEALPHIEVWPRMQQMFAELMRPLLQNWLTTELPSPQQAGVVSFDLLGADVLVDSDFRPWLIEFNQLPDMQLMGDPAVSAARASIVNDLLEKVLHSTVAAGCFHASTDGCEAWEPLVCLERSSCFAADS
eukprot:TRINITY_DN23982_c0_g1_i1.p1 TRINITY_DN23982_c0_g1~~TRINITY_DN23982_c0_g1_i1.p1  ORF type:complete len:393 (-),score=35.38 TRINITY_DN23982_c0_g1_i1:17-1144(-)